MAVRRVEGKDNSQCHRVAKLWPPRCWHLPGLPRNAFFCLDGQFFAVERPLHSRVCYVCIHSMLSKFLQEGERTVCHPVSPSVGMCEHMEGSFVGTETQAQPLFSRSFQSYWSMGYTGSFSAVEIVTVIDKALETLVRGKKGRIERLEITHI